MREVSKTQVSIVERGWVEYGKKTREGALSCDYSHKRKILLHWSTINLPLNHDMLANFSAPITMS